MTNKYIKLYEDFGDNGGYQRVEVDNDYGYGYIIGEYDEVTEITEPKLSN